MKRTEKEISNEHPLAKKAETDRVEVAGLSFRDLKNLPGNSLTDKVEKKLGIKITPKFTLKEAIKLLQKKLGN